MRSREVIQTLLKVCGLLMKLYPVKRDVLASKSCKSSGDAGVVGVYEDSVKVDKTEERFVLCSASGLA